MKKILSLVLVLVMVLGLSVTAFAAGGYDLYINDVQVTAEGEISNAAITDGTVTYTAAKDGNPAKLTLNGATIAATGELNNAIKTASGNLVIELIGENTVTATELGFYINGDATFIGSGSLTVNAVVNAINTVGNCTFSMSGTVEAKSSTNAGIYSSGNIYITDGAGKVTARGNTYGILINGDEVSGYRHFVGSTDIEENDETKMTPIAMMVLPSGESYSAVQNPISNAKTVRLIARDPYSGSTTVTAVKEALPVKYEIVIPSAVTMTEAGVKEIGAATINMEEGKLENATAKTVISYTASGTNFTKSDDSTKTMDATYYTAYTDADNNTVLGTAAITVYENSALVDPLTTISVGVTKDAWDAAEAGTYTATVNYNFDVTDSVPGVFKAVHDTNTKTLSFYYDMLDYSGDGKTVYQNGTKNYLFNDAEFGEEKWGYYDDLNWDNSVEHVVINESVKNYHGLTDTAYMFCELAYAKDIIGAEYLDVSHVTSMAKMFYEFGFSVGESGEGSVVGAPNVANWDTSNVTDMGSLFEDYAYWSSTINDVPNVSGWNTGNVTNMDGVFAAYGYSSSVLNKVPDVSKWNTDKVKNLEDVFACYACDSPVLDDVPNVSNWNTAKVTNMDSVFGSYGENSTELSAAPDVSNWNTDKVTNMYGVFSSYGENSMKLSAVPDVSGWNTENVTTMEAVFYFYGKSSTALNTMPAVSGWNTAKVMSTANMFNCYGMTSSDLEFTLDLSGWDLSSVTNTYKMFEFYDWSDPSAKFNGKSWTVTIPATTGEKTNDTTHWYCNGENFVSPEKDQSFTVAGAE